MVGSLGSHLDDNTSDIWTYQQLQRYMANQGDGVDGLHGDISSFAWWQWASVSSDTGGILEVGCRKSSCCGWLFIAQAAGDHASHLWRFWLRTLCSLLPHELLAGGCEPAMQGTLPATCTWAAANGSAVGCSKMLAVAAGRVSMLWCFALDERIMQMAAA